MKTACKQYPTRYLSTKSICDRFNSISVVHNDDSGKKIMAAIMYMDRDRRYFITTTSSIEKVSTNSRQRWRMSETCAISTTVTVRLPRAVELYYSVYGQIDRHNRNRKAVLNMEKKIRTQSWSFWICSSILAVIVVDSWCFIRDICAIRAATMSKINLSFTIRLQPSRLI